MCGFAGFVDFEGRPAAQWLPALDQMHRAIGHRGPDGWGRVVLERDGVCETSSRGSRPDRRERASGATVGLTHTRLAIIDLTEGGHQPMADAAGRSWLAYNGEIYNYQALRQRLRDRGMSPRSTSDTEVLAGLLASDGPHALPELRGMFAFAWWDDRAQRLLLARDRFGIKPLVYSRPAPGLVLFASTPRALLASGLVDAAQTPGAAAHFFTRGSIASSSAVWPSIHSVPPAAWAQVDPAGVSCQEYWSLERTLLQPRDARPVREAALAARRAIAESVEAHLVSDVPVAVFLSGGIDSTAVLAAAREVTASPIQTFTVTMPGGRMDESVEARRAARQFGSEHTEVSLQELDVDEALDEFFSAVQMPSVDGFNTFLVARAARQAGVRVALAGTGGDELFGGYDSFVGVPRVAIACRLLGPLAPSIGRGLRRWPSPRIAKLGAILRARPDGVSEGWWEYRRLFADDDVLALAGSTIAPDVPPTDADPFSTVRWLEIRHYLMPQLLGDMDAFTMCRALEVRTPLVDHKAMADIARAGRWRRRHGETFKQTLFRELPELIAPGAVSRPKQGFVLPFDTWIRAALTERSPARLRDFSGRLRRDQHAPLVRRYLEQRLHWSRLWAVYVWERWRESVREPVGSHRHP